ncbi:uncharacterized protein LOC110028467 [Phalaenopsis equestris]|uniref:uncharacterized protein LOC110028467 n=1 Tax=Phalaenopsis equestris TaxID=78828 RepID=UPI0009E33A1D|nr:uncharacterized protein LOC110028467 [Phalaenopsis equestris]
MGQVLRKPKPGDKDDLLLKEQLEIKKLIHEELDEKFASIESTIKSLDDFYQVIYEFVEILSEKKGAMQYKLPAKESLRKEVTAVLDNRGVLANKNLPLTKEEVKKVIQNVIKIENFQIGQGAKDIFLYIFGVPVVSLLAKRIIPGPTASIPDELFIPAVTSGTIIFLAKTNRI